jgi:hypothetical protein
VIPETIDCISALTAPERDPSASVAKIDRSLGVLKTF